MTSVESAHVQRKLAAILSADVKGYSRLMGEDEVATIRTLTTYRELMFALIRQYRGRVVDSPGDNLLAEFASVIDAVRCAVEMQKTLKTRNADLPASRKMEFRIGINVGDVVVEGDRIYGDGVNIAARLEGLAEPGGICVSGVVYDQVENKLTSLGLSYISLGEQTVKNIAKPVAAYQIVLEPTALERTEALPLPVPVAAPPPPIIPIVVPDKPSIAVLPFTNLSGDPEQEYFSDGITEDIITDLSKVSGLFVISRNSSFLYKGKIVKPEQVGQDLGVRYLLEGSVRKAGNRVRITAQLIDTNTGYHLWAERYDRERQDIFALQDEVTQQIVCALQVKLTDSEECCFGRTPTTNMEAYECFLRGLELFSQRSKEANAQARELFEQAIRLDANFAAAYARLGRTHILDWAFQWKEDPQCSGRAVALARQAIDLDPTLPGAHQTLAYVYLMQKQFDQAIVEAETAVRLDPNDADALVTLGEILSCAGRSAESLNYIEKALLLDPHYPPSFLFALGQSYYLLGRHEEALATFKRVLTRNPTHLRTYFFVAIIHYEQGRKEEAQAALRAAKKINPAFSFSRMKAIVPYKDTALVDRWMQQLEELGVP
jgi:adenylate cyclase